MNARAKELLAVGLAAYEKAPNDGPAMVYAIAAMLAAPAKSRTRRADDPSKLPFSPQELHQALLARVGDKVLCTPVEGRLFGYLGRRLQQINGLERDDLDRVVSYFECGGWNFWSTQPTFEHVCHHIGKLVTTAREWDKRGRQTLKRGGSNVGAAEAVGDVSGAFR